MFSINVFLTDNLMYFFFFLECFVFPMVFLIGYFGPRAEKTKAATLYFYFSLLCDYKKRIYNIVIEEASS